MANGDDPGIGGILGGVGDIVNNVTATVNYWSDPWGNTFKALQGAAVSMTRDIMPALTSATLPDLTTDWFINAYKISFATAIFVAVLLLIPQAVRTARGAQAGRDLVESIGLYFGLFLVGAMFGPALGIILIQFFHSLTDVFVAAGLTGTLDSITVQFETMLNQTDPVGISGGVVMAVPLMTCIILGLFLVLLMLLVQLVTLYFTGVLFPLGLVWIIDKNKRGFGLKIATLWIGILAAHPLLFLLLGLAFSMMANQLNAFGNNFSLQSMVTLLVAIIALMMAAFSPVLLMKFAPVIPMAFGGTNGPSAGTIGPIGAPNITEATSRFYQANTEDAPVKPTSPSSPPDSAGAPAPAGTTTASLAEAAGTAGATTGASTETAGAKGTGGGRTVITSGSAREQGASDHTAAGTGVAATLGAAGTEGAAGSTATVGAEGALAAAGTAESATGAGAVVGAPTLIAALGIAAVHKGAQLVQQAGEKAAASMDDTPNVGGS
ncbi:hypothetical protein E3O44_06875 [Cryobacterium algoricola]|uniref:Type IV secretion system protein n=1 Tax=Cryobacterium algoricola TaxID=1259183 RepID=A0ABY2IC01_9MICO|nr:hypothetical protein [Cryobacterium algoricola]TFB86884.1 hypothetical protein E3O44_06875 [Cryobacterium algoricola]